MAELSAEDARAIIERFRDAVKNSAHKIKVIDRDWEIENIDDAAERAMKVHYLGRWGITDMTFLMLNEAEREHWRSVVRAVLDGA